MGARVEPLGEDTTHLVAEDAGSPVFAVRPAFRACPAVLT
jgi:hypothetical protein